jgi:hypothetical protein
MKRGIALHHRASYHHLSILYHQFRVMVNGVENVPRAAPYQCKTAMFPKVVAPTAKSNA